MSAIGWRGKNEIFWQCGGSLISEKFVISVAHCTLVDSAKPDVIRVGDLDLKRTDDGASPQDFNIKNIFTHPNYQIEFKYHDIALFELDRNAM